MNILNLLQVTFATYNELNGNEIGLAVGTSFSAWYHYATRTLNSYIGGDKDEVHWTCDVHDRTDNDVFMTCKSFVSNNVRPCGIENYVIVVDNYEVSSVLGTLTETYIANIFKDLN